MAGNRNRTYPQSDLTSGSGVMDPGHFPTEIHVRVSKHLHKLDFLETGSSYGAQLRICCRKLNAFSNDIRYVPKKLQKSRENGPKSLKNLNFSRFTVAII